GRARGGAPAARARYPDFAAAHTFDVGMAASCGRASERCPRFTIASVRSRRTSGAMRARVVSRSERSPTMRQYCLGRAGDQPGERLEPGAIAPGEHEGPETIGGGRFHSPLSMRRWARTFRAARRAREGPIRVVTLRPRQDEAEAVRRARDVLLDRRLLGDQAAEWVA